MSPLRKILIGGAATVALAAGLAMPAGAQTPATGTTASTAPASIVGAWSVTVAGDGVSFGPHEFVFGQSGTMLSFNPSRVQEHPDGSGVNDAAGAGVWKATDLRHGVYVGTFIELNANQATNVQAPTLSVTWRITIRGDQLTGNAVASLSNDPTTYYQATFAGHRITVDWTALDHVATS